MLPCVCTHTNTHTHTYIHTHTKKNWNQCKLKCLLVTVMLYVLFLRRCQLHLCSCHCQAKFVEKYNFDIHLKYRQACRDANPQVFKCGKCGDLFTTLINRQQHKAMRSQMKCPISSSQRSKLRSNTGRSFKTLPLSIL